MTERCHGLALEARVSPASLPIFKASRRKLGGGEINPAYSRSLASLNMPLQHAWIEVKHNDVVAPATRMQMPTSHCTRNRTERFSAPAVARGALLYPLSLARYRRRHGF
jgi:hypothetical protein